MDRPIIIWKRHIENKITSCSFHIWEGQSCCEHCGCNREGLILSGGVRLLDNYGYRIPFKWKMV